MAWFVVNHLGRQRSFDERLETALRAYHVDDFELRRPARGWLLLRVGRLTPAVVHAVHGTKGSLGLMGGDNPLPLEHDEVRQLEQPPQGRPAVKIRIALIRAGAPLAPPQRANPYDSDTQAALRNAPAGKKQARMAVVAWAMAIVLLLVLYWVLRLP